MPFEISEEHDALPAVHAAVRQGIREADPADVGRRDYELLALALRDGDGRLRGGAYGATMWGWLMVDGLWVATELRGQGYGSRLLDAAESVAMRRGCRGAWLGTFDFQARSFYERNGYRVHGQLAGFPSGHTHFHLAKRFGDSLPVAPSPSRQSHEAPEVIARRGWRYHHVGIPTTVPRPNEIHLAKYGVYIAGFSTSPFGIEWMRFEETSPLHPLIKSVPHVAFEVDDLDAALEGYEVISPPGSPSDGVRAAMIVVDGAPVELIWFSRNARPAS